MSKETAAKEWYHRNKEKVAAYKKEYYERNKELCKERASKFNKSERRKQWRLENKGKISEYGKQRWLQIKELKPHLKKEYGITLEIYNQMLEEQDFRCLGCNIPQENLDHPLHVDHCHATGKVRGLLCKKCNSVLGLASDNIETLENLINYLKREQPIITSKD